MRLLDARRTVVLWASVAGVAIAPLAGCARAERASEGGEEATADRSVDRIRGRLEELADEMAALIGERVASDSAFCRLQPVGSKPCGGPSFFLVYSSETADSVRLSRLVAEYDSLAEEVNREAGLVSDCRVETPPRVVWEEGRCTAVPRTRRVPDPRDP